MNEAERIGHMYAPTRTPEYLPWMDDALCAETDPEAFHPEKGGTPRPAKAICGRCDVAAQCLAYALEHPVSGIWGGLTEKERRAIARERKAAA